MVKRIMELALSESNKKYISYGSRDTQKLISALNRALIDGSNSISLVHYAEILNPKLVKDFTYAMSQLGLCTSKVKKKWASLELNMAKLYEFVPKSEIDNYRIFQQFQKYTLRLDKERHAATLVKTVNGIEETGLSRKGFAKVAKNEFQFDTTTMLKYKDAITATAVKTITKAVEKGNIKDAFFIDPANYEVVVKLCLEYYMADPSQRYNLEQNISDSRGRSIFKALKRVFNPVSSKDARALLAVPTPTTVTTLNKAKLNDIYYFIAELCGSKAKSEAQKIISGKKFYNSRKLPNIDLTTEHGRDELHELIWLERIYAMLDELAIKKVVQWNIPLEVDASMSINQFVGALTNEIRLLERTNVIGDELSDPWHIEGVKRSSGKAVGTPVFYGSSQSAKKLLKANGITPCRTEIKLINKEFSQGAFSITKMFKNAIISNYSNHAPSIKIKIFNDEFVVHCNKFKTVDSTINITTAYDSDKRKYSTAITRKPIRIPDYSRFKLFWATCLIHNLDSQSMDNIAIAIDEWMLTIHDAVIALPGTCGKVRKQYSHELKAVNENRRTIIRDFRNSIGATSMKADIDFMKLDKAVQQADEEVFNASAMK